MWRGVLLAALMIGGCGGGSVAAPAAAPQLGDANPGIPAPMLASFQRGKTLFEKRFTRSEGLGPDFNVSSCASCHEVPVTGGSAPLYRNFFLVGRIENGAFKQILDDDQFVARNFSFVRTARETIPANAEIVAQRNAIPIFGVGAFESIPAADILANEDPDDTRNPDGISGRINVDGALVGRFGVKAQESTIEDFVRAPAFNHMGITSLPLASSAPLREDLGSAPQIFLPGSPKVDNDGVADPELGAEDLFDLVTYTRELAPPPLLPLDAESERGEQIFGEIGCAKCHIPNIVRNGTPVLAYTDLLLHDMGPGLADGIPMGVSTGSEFRTQPLWGVRHTAPFLHDGRADTLEEAILLHGGEAMAVRNAFAALTVADRTAVIRFLETR